MKNLPIIFLGFWVVVIILLVGCTTANDQFIQGKWVRGDVNLWEEWYFSQGTYLHIYHDTDNHTEELGRYFVLESGDNYTLLELYDHQGGIPSIEDRVEMMIKFDRQANTIHLRDGDFTKVLTSTLNELTTGEDPR